MLCFGIVNCVEFSLMSFVVRSFNALIKPEVYVHRQQLSGTFFSLCITVCEHRLIFHPHHPKPINLTLCVNCTESIHDQYFAFGLV